MEINHILEILFLGIIAGAINCQVNLCGNVRENPTNPMSYYEKVGGKDILRLCVPGKMFKKTLCKCENLLLMQFGGLGAGGGAAALLGGGKTGGSMSGGMNFQSRQFFNQGPTSHSSSGGGSVGGLANGKSMMISSNPQFASGLSGGRTGGSTGGFISGLTGSGTGSTTSSRKFKITLPFNPLLLKWTKSGQNGMNVGGWGSGSGSLNTKGSWGSGSSQTGSWGSNSVAQNSFPWLNDLQFMGGNMRPHGEFIPFPKGGLTNINVSGDKRSNLNSWTAGNIFTGAGGYYPFQGQPMPGFSMMPQFPQGGFNINGSMNYQMKRELVRVENGKPIYRYLIRTNKFGQPIPQGSIPGMHMPLGSMPGLTMPFGSMSSYPGMPMPSLPLQYRPGMPFHPSMVFGGVPSTGTSLANAGASNNAWIQQNFLGNTGGLALTPGASGSGPTSGMISSVGPTTLGVNNGHTQMPLSGITSNAGQASHGTTANVGQAAGSGKPLGPWKWVVDATGAGRYVWDSSGIGAASATAFYNQGSGTQAKSTGSQIGAAAGNWKWVADSTAPGKGRYVWVSSRSSGVGVGAGVGTAVGTAVGTGNDFWSANAAMGRQNGVSGFNGMSGGSYGNGGHNYNGAGGIDPLWYLMAGAGGSSESSESGEY